MSKEIPSSSSRTERKLNPEEMEKFIKEVKSFVEKNLRKLPEDPVSCNKCIDGRPSRNKEDDICENGEKPAAFPGADLGAAMLLLEQGMSAEQAASLMLEFLGEKGYVFNFHSDTHHEEEGKGVIGCGHANASFENNDYYNFDKNEVEKLIRFFKDESRKGNPNVKEDILVGDHHERAILIIEDPSESVDHYDPETGEQYFVYDRVAHMKYISSLARFLQSKGFDISEESLKKAAERQAQATLSLLSSSKGKPMFIVGFDEYNGNQVTVGYLGDAPEVSR